MNYRILVSKFSMLAPVAVLGLAQCTNARAAFIESFVANDFGTSAVDISNSVPGITLSSYGSRARGDVTTLPFSFSSWGTDGLFGIETTTPFQSGRSFLNAWRTNDANFRGDFGFLTDFVSVRIRGVNFADSNAIVTAYGTTGSVVSSAASDPVVPANTEVFLTVSNPTRDIAYFTVTNQIGLENEYYRISRVDFRSFDEPVPDPVPEPSSLALLGMGIIGLGGVHWRRKRKTELTA